MELTPALTRTTIKAALASRGLRPAAELAAGKPCGTRVRYYAGCRCTECKAANTAYERQRQAARKRGEWNGLVSADRARQHIEQLRAKGIGWKTIADAAKVGSGVVYELIYGSKAKVRAGTEAAILRVTEACAPDHAYIDAAPTWVLLDELLACGYSRARLASEILGRPARALQLQRGQVTVLNAARVRAVWERLRLASAQETRAAQTQLQELSDEGFHRARVTRWLDALAAKRGLPSVDLDLRQGRMLHAATVLIHGLHRHLTGECLYEPADDSSLQAPFAVIRNFELPAAPKPRKGR